MAMSKCKECGKEVSNKASSCPHCGVKNPGMDAKSTAKGCLGIIIFSVIFSTFMVMCSDSNDDSTAGSNLSDAECMATLQCWGEKNIIMAGAYCQVPIEKMAKYTHEWTDGFTTPRFSHYRWKDQSTGVVTYIGDQIKMQNGFGAWSHYTYECDFAPQNNLVLDVRAQQGRL